MSSSARLPVPRVHGDDYEFRLGKAVRLREGSDVTIVGIAPEQFFGDRVTSNPPSVFLACSDSSQCTGSLGAAARQAGQAAVRAPARREGGA